MSESAPVAPEAVQAPVPVSTETPAAEPAPAATPRASRPTVEEPTEPTSRLYIGNIPPVFRVANIRELVASYGKSTIQIRNPTRGPRARKFAFVSFSSPEVAAKARTELADKVVLPDTQPIKVAFATPPPAPTKSDESKAEGTKPKANKPRAKATSSAEGSASAGSGSEKPAAAPKKRTPRERLPDSVDSVYVQGLQKGTTEDDLLELFSKFPGAHATIVVRPAKRERVYQRYTLAALPASTIAFVRVGADHQERAILELNDVEFKGSKITVRKATMSYDQAVAEGKIQPREQSEPKAQAEKSSSEAQSEGAQAGDVPAEAAPVEAEAKPKAEL